MPFFSENICLGDCVVQHLSGLQGVNYPKVMWHSVCKAIHAVETELTTL